MPDLLNLATSYSYEGLLAIITPYYSQALAQGQAIAANTHAIAGLFSQANTIADPAARAARLAELGTLSRTQAQLVLDHRGFVNKWNAAINALNNWAASQGIGVEGPPMLLSGLGVLPAIVPVSIVLLFVGLGIVAFLAYEKSRTDAITRILNDPTLTAAQKDALLKQAKPDSIEGIIKAATVALVVVLAIQVVPKLIPQRRTA